MSFLIVKSDSLLVLAIESGVAGPWTMPALAPFAFLESYPLT